MTNDYEAFIGGKSQLGGAFGFEPTFLPDCLFDFQKALVEWACRKGRAAIFASCGLGKTLIQLAWAENVVRHTNNRVLILTPLSVSWQTVTEGQKFGIECDRSQDGKVPSGAKILVTNYERLHYFNPADFVGTVADESGILKSYDGSTRDAVVEFMRTQPYRLLCTATPSPNDYIELGNSSEAVGELGFMDMLGKFFKKTAKATKSRGREFEVGKWAFRGHAERDFWRWVVSWARAIQKPSDLGFDDGKFLLPPLDTVEHVIKAHRAREGYLFDLPAKDLRELREERRRTLEQRCELAAEIIIQRKECSIAWCHLNDEGDLLQSLIPGSAQVSGANTDDEKEETYRAFVAGEIRVMVSKPTVSGFGLNLQVCAHQTFFPSHSFEQWHQAVRRSWRFGQTRPVRVDVIASEGERGVLVNIQRKAMAAETIYARLVELMDNELRLAKPTGAHTKEEIPSWL